MERLVEKETYTIEVYNWNEEIFELPSNLYLNSDEKIVDSDTNQFVSKDYLENELVNELDSFTQFYSIINICVYNSKSEIVYHSDNFNLIGEDENTFINSFVPENKDNWIYKIETNDSFDIKKLSIRRDTCVEYDGEVYDFFDIYGTGKGSTLYIQSEEEYKKSLKKHESNTKKPTDSKINTTSINFDNKEETINESSPIKDCSDYKLFSWTGSKQKYSSNFQEVLNKIDTKEKIDVEFYIEGFSGSLMSIFHNLKKVNPKNIVINDINKKIINLYIQIKNDPKRVFKGYEMIEDKFNSLIPKGTPKKRVYPKDRREEIEKIKEFYYYIRNHINTGDLDWVHSSCMLFLLNHNFNGLYNENKKGYTNTSFNWSTKPINIEKIKQSLFNLSEFLNSREVIFETLDINTLVSKYNHHDTFIYLDPPYINSGIQYSKKRSKSKSFNEVETHKELLNSVSKFKYVMYSNNHHDEFITLCDGFVNFDRPHTITNKKSNKSLKEILSYKINNRLPVNNTEYSNDEKEIVEVVNNQNYIPINSQYNFKLGTCFSGLGCPEYVLKELNVPHTTEFVCDINKYCRKTLVKNYNPKRVFDDISKLTIDKLPNTYLDCYIWGSPCQDLSQSNNKREGLKGEKSKLFYEGFRILKETQPKYSIFENVPGLLSSNNGEDFKEVMRLFEELRNYDIYWKKINPVDIGGNTTRVRVFVVLIRKDINIKFNFPKEIKSTKCIKDCLITGDYQYINKGEYIPWERPIKKQRGKLKKDFRLTNVSRQEQSRVFNINYPCPTIQRSGVVHINDGIGVRKMSPEELKLIQGLDNLDMSHLSRTQMLSQLGNTMEVETMKKLIGEIVRIDKIHFNKSKTQELKKVS